MRNYKRGDKVYINGLGGGVIISTLTKIDGLKGERIVLLNPLYRVRLFAPNPQQGDFRLLYSDEFRALNLTAELAQRGSATRRAVYIAVQRETAETESLDKALRRLYIRRSDWRGLEAVPPVKEPDPARPSVRYNDLNTDPRPGERLLTREEAAQAMGVRPWVLDRYRRRGAVAAHYIEGCKQPLFRKCEVQSVPAS